MRKSYVLIVGAVVLAIVWVLWMIAGPKPSVQYVSGTPSVTPSPMSDAKFVAFLGPVVGDVGKGNAVRKFEGGTFQLMVIAELVPPDDGKFYEGWLTKGASSTAYVSMGKLEQRSEGIYVGAFSTSTSYMDYTQIVITQEAESKGLGGSMTGGVLQGSFIQ